MPSPELVQQAWAIALPIMGGMLVIAWIAFLVVPLLVTIRRHKALKRYAERKIDEQPTDLTQTPDC